MNITSLQELLVHVCDTCDPSNSKATNMSLVFELWWVIRLEGNNSPTGLYPSNYTQPVICYIFLRVTMATVRAFISPGVSIISGAISLMGSDTSFLFGGWVAVNLFSSWLLLRCQPLNGHHWYTSAPCSLMVIVQICLLPDLWRVNGIIYVYIYIYPFVCNLFNGENTVLFSLCTFFSTFPDTQVCTEAAAFHCDVSEVV